MRVSPEQPPVPLEDALGLPYLAGSAAKLPLGTDEQEFLPPFPGMVDAEPSVTEPLSPPFKPLDRDAIVSALASGDTRFGDRVIGALKAEIGRLQAARQQGDGKPQALTVSALEPPRASRRKSPKSPEELALAHRHSRVRSGPLGQALGEIMEEPEARSMVRTFMGRRAQFGGRVQRPGQLHASLAPAAAALMSVGEWRQRVMRGLDDAATEESARLVNELPPNRVLEADVAVAGAGPQGSVLTAALRADFPEAKIVGVDPRNLLGGQFRGYGDSDQRPVHGTNSRNFRPEDINVVGIPGGSGNLNSFGPQAPFQVPHWTSATYGTNLDFGDPAAANQFVSATTLLGYEAIDYTPLGDGRAETLVIDPETGDEIIIRARQTIIASEAGERLTFEGVTVPSFLSAEDFLSHFGNPNNNFPMDKFIGKRIAVIGAGDTGRVVNEMLAWLGPPGAYGSSIVQLGGPREIFWYGTNFSNRQEYCDANRSRYRPLASFIREGFGDPNLILPIEDKAEEIVSANGRVGVRTGGTTNFFDYVIDCTPLTPNLPAFLQAEFDNSTIINGALEELGISDAQIGRLSVNGLWFAAAAARLSLTDEERATFADGLKENTLAYWANTPRTLAVKRRVSLALAS